MAKKKIGEGEIDFDNLDFDDFDFDIPDFEDPDPANDTRSPIQKLSSGFKEGFKENIASSANIKNSLGKALPRGYGQAINVYDNVSDTAQELYHSVASDIKPITDGLRIASGKISPKIKAKLPKSLSDKLENFANGGFESGNYSASKLKSDSEESQIANSLSEMFQAQAERNTDEFVNNKADEAVRDVIDKKRHSETVGQGSIIAQGISRLVGYQDQVLSKFHRKTLELQYRQYFVAKDLLDSSNVNQQKIVDALGKVVINTALPEAVKIHKSEMASMMLKERMINRAFGTAGNYTRNFRENLTKNVKSIVGGFTGTMSMGADAAGQMGDVPGGAAGLVGNAAGSRAAEYLHDKVSNAASPFFNKFPGLRRFGAKIGNFIEDSPNRLNEYAKSETEDTGARGTLEDIFKAIIPQFNLDDKIQSSNILSSDRPANFDNLTRRSIVEVIPGWLSQINRWVKASATGVIDSEKNMDVYNLDKGKFTSSKEYLKDIKRNVQNKREDDSTKQYLDTFVDKLEGDDKTLSPEARRIIKKKVVSDAAKGNKFNPSRMASREEYEGASDEDIEAIVKLFKTKFNIDIDGTVSDDVDNLDSINDFNGNFNSIRSTLPETGDRIRLLHQVLGKSNFEALGLTSRENNQDVINYDSEWNRLAGYEETVEEDKPDVKIDDIKRKRKRATRERPPRPTPPPQPLPPPLPNRETDSECDPCASNETYFGKESLLISILSGIQTDVQASNVSELIAQSTSILGEIALRLNSMNTRPGAPPSEQRRDANWLYGKGKAGFKSGLDFAGRLGKGYFNKSMSFYKGLGHASTWSAGKAFGAVGAIGKAAGNKLFEKAKVPGLYLKGQLDALQPKLTQSGIDAKEYWDVNGKKWITKLSDITGEVVDKAGKAVITADEYAKGLVTENGKTFRGKAANALSTVTGLGVSLMTAPYKALWSAGRSVVKGLFGKQRETMDLYLKGDQVARLKKTLMEKGDEYFDAVTGDPIKKLSDIKGAVKDKFGDVIVDLKELQQSHGFWSATGEAIKIAGKGTFNLALGAAKLYGKAMLLPFKAVAWAGKKIMKGIRSLKKGKFSAGTLTGKPDEDLVSIGFQQLSIQEQMFKFLRDRFAKKKGIGGDADGDGDRDGSLKDILANRKAKKEAAKAAALGGLVPKFGTDGKPVPGAAEEGMSATEGGMLGAAGVAAYGAVKTGAKTAAQWVGKKLFGAGTRAALGTAARFVGKQVLWRGAQLAGTALLGVVSAPVLLGAAAVGGLGYGAYKLYKHIADKPMALSGMRYAQYGINPREAEQIAPIAALEEMFVKNTTYSTDSPARVGKSGMNPEEIFKIFGIDPTKEENEERMLLLTKWIATRFMPVYIAHATALNKLSKGVSLAEIDKNLPVQQYLDFIKEARLDNLAEVYDDTDTSPFDDELDSDADTVTKWVEDAINITKVKLAALPEEPKEKASDTMNKVVVTAFADATTRDDTEKPKGSVVSAKGDTSNGAGALAYLSKATSDFGSGVLTGLTIGIPGVSAMVAAWGALSAIKGRILGGRKRPKVTLDAMTAGRYKVYGLVELDLDKVEAIYTLEEAMFSDVKYNAEKAAYYEGSAETIYPLVSVIFGIDNEDTEHRANWFGWYRYRFLPTFTQFCTSVRNKQSIDAKDATDKLTLDEQHEVLVETSTAKVNYGGTEVSVWLVPVSPWKDYKLNDKEDSIAGNIEALKTAGKRKGYKENTLNVTNAKTEIEMAKRQEDMDTDGNPVAPGSDPDKDKPGFWSKTMDTIFGGKAPDGQRTGGMVGRDASPGKDYSNGTAQPLGGGNVIQEHPGGGTGGDINSVPSPTGDGWAGAKETILAAAKMVGFDPSIAATVAAVESGFKPGVKAGTSSAGGYFQFIDSTWTAMLQKYGAKYGLAANASKYDGRANALMGMEFLKENSKILDDSLERPVTDTDLYAAHFLGPAGARRFLTAAPGSDARQAVGENVPGANHNIFYDKSNNARTVSGVYSKFDELLTSKRKMHDLVPGEQPATPKVDEMGNLAGNAAGSTPPPGAVSTDGTTSTPIPTQADTVSGVSALPVGIAAPVVMGAQPTADPVGPVPMGSQGASIVEEGKASAAAQGIQSTSNSGLTTPVAMDTVTEVPPASVTAAMAQKQSSVESGALNDSVTSVKDIMSLQLEVQTSMNSTLSEILENIKNRPVSENGKAVVATTSTPSTPPSRTTSNSGVPQQLQNVPINVGRKQAS